MATARRTPPRPEPRRQRHTLRWVAAGVVGVAVAIVALAVVAFTHSGVELGDDAVALAAVHVGAFGGTVQSVSAVDGKGKNVPLSVEGDLITPTRKVKAGDDLKVTVTVKRPGWDGWALGSTKTERLTIKAPTVDVASQWVTAAPGSGVQVNLSAPAMRVAYATGDDKLRRHALDNQTRVSIPEQDAAGTLRVAAAARSWERLGQPTTVHFFPRSSHASVLVSPAPGGDIGPEDTLKLTFSKPVKDVLGNQQPTLSDGVDGHWKQTDEHTLQFVPTGAGFGFGQDVSVKLPQTVDAVAAGDKSGTQTDTLQWKVPGASTLRLNQLLAETGYLPLTWTPSAQDADKTVAAQSHAAVEPPDGTFDWTYDNTPSELTEQWVPDQVTELTRGAVMMFQDEHDLTVDALAGPAVWKALIADVVAGHKHEGGYSYVYVHRKVPQKLTLWHDGKIILTSPGNTGVPAAPTELGTFPVFEHLKETTMSGTNPDGSHYNDPGVKWVSYFNGGDALHEFPRASFGTPQSLGCVELPEASAKKVWPYTPIGTLVTIEN